MSQTLKLPVSPETGHSNRLPLRCAYLIEVLTSISSNLLMNGVAFYTTQRFGWSTSQNLLLMMVQGFTYAAGALSAGALAGRFHKSKLLLAVNAALLVMIAAMFASDSPWTIIPILLAFTYTSTFTWPLVESTITEGCTPVQMNRRITLYNMCWSSVCVAVIAVYGTILEYWPAGPMVITFICQGIGLVAAIAMVASSGKTVAATPHETHGDPEIAAKLASQRRLALWLSRLSLPAVFVIANSIMGLFPKFPLTEELGLVWATVIASLWMASRFVTFIFLGMTSWWHTRPRMLLGCAIALLLSFLVIAIPAERMGIFGTMPLWVIVSLVSAGELALGVAAGFIFSASLYFGMVLSDGSAKHGAYHEALIGVGMVIGPGLASGAQALIPAATSMPAIMSVTVLMLLTLGFSAAVSTKYRARQTH